MIQEEKTYDGALKKLRTMRDAWNNLETDYSPKDVVRDIEYYFPELAESEDDKIRKEIKVILANTDFSQFALDYTFADMIIWLEKQSNTNETINSDKFAQSVLRGAAINLITWIDYNAAEGNMCLSNTECKDIEDALVNGDWNKIYAYMKKKLEKQDEKQQGKSALEAIHEEKVDNANVVPIFNVGDTIVKKHNSDINKFGQFTITDITGGKYWYNDRIICDIVEQDDWELVEKSAKWSEEDEIRLDRICKTLWKNRKGDTDEIFQQEQDVEWLKTLKQRIVKIKL